MNSKYERFKGVFTALLTPYHKDGSIHTESLKKMVEYGIAKGVNGFYIGGSTSEAFLLSQEERKQLFKTAIETCKGRAVAICHAGAISTKHSIDMAQYAESIGADAISAVTPFYYPLSADEIVAHYKAITNAVSLPFIAYCIPGFSGVSFKPEHFRSLYEHDRIIGVKYTHFDLYAMERIKQINPERIVYSGFDESCVGGVAMGADGIVGSTFNFFAADYIKIRSLIHDGKVDEALVIQHKLNDFIDVLLEAGVFAGLKYILSKQLNIETNGVRAPLKQLNSKDMQRFDALLSKYGYS